MKGLPSRGRRFAVTTALAGLLMAGGTTAVAAQSRAAGSATSGTRREVEGAVAPHATATVALSLREHFSAFRPGVVPDATLDQKASTASSPAASSPPLSTVRAVTGSDVSSYDLDVGAATPVPTSDGTIWAVPGDNGVCLERSLPSTGNVGACAGINTPYGAESGRFAITSGTGSAGSGPLTVNVSGLVPDGNSSVTVALANGSTVVAPVIDNVYSVTVTDPVEVIAKNVNGAAATVNVAVPQSPAAK